MWAMLYPESSCSSTAEGSSPCYNDNNINPISFPFYSCPRFFPSSPHQRPRPGRRRRWQRIATPDFMDSMHDIHASDILRWCSRCSFTYREEDTRQLRSRWRPNAVLGQYCSFHRGHPFKDTLRYSTSSSRRASPSSPSRRRHV